MTQFTQVIVGFPGVGKSVLSENAQTLNVSDSDSSLFSWIEPGVRHPEFPDNYIAHIKEMMKTKDYVFVSSHNVVREALNKEQIPYTIVYPDKSLKEEYLERYRNRGSFKAFINLMEYNFEGFIDELEAETYPVLHKLGSNEYLGDLLSSPTK